MGTQRLDEVVDELRAFAAERDWEQYHDPKNLAMALASEAGELLAVLRWVANEESDAFVRSADYRSAIEDEVADVGITLLLFCERAGIDLLDAMAAKIEVNRQRYPADRVRGRWERPTGEP
jgi:NTP pyrophosphatase (non-canonical NTP hydrolase)